MNVGLYGLGVKLVGWCGVRTVVGIKQIICGMAQKLRFVQKKHTSRVEMQTIIAVMENEKMANILATIGYILLLIFVLEILIFVAVGIYAFWKDMNDL